MTSYDAIVIGGGHNGLVAAALLGRSGRSVLLLEAADEPGGAARTEEFFPGFRVSRVAHIINRLHPEVVRALALQRHGLKLEGRAMPSVALSPDGPLVLRGAYGETLEGARPSEVLAWAGLRAQLISFAGVLKPFLTRRPPSLQGLTGGDKAALAGAALSLKRLGREAMRDFLRMMLMNVTDVLDEHLADDRLRGLLAFDAVLGSHLGPRSPTSLLGLYYRLAGEIGGAPGGQMLPPGGTGAVIAALEKAVVAAGVDVRTGVAAVGISVEAGKATGVVLADGTAIRAPAVLSAINPSTTFLKLVGPRELDTDLVRRLTHIRLKGDAAKLNLALDRAPEFTGVSAADHRGRLVIAPSAEAVERAFNPAKYGAFSAEPVMEITLPSLSDGQLASPGRCVLSAVVQYAPYDLKQGWEAGRPKLLEAIMRRLEGFAPGIGATVLHADLLTPVDIEALYRMPGGHWHHGELQPDQMFVSRPVADCSGYETPIEGLFLCGAGSHPGGGVSGVPGLNAARFAMARSRT